MELASSLLGSSEQTGVCAQTATTAGDQAGLADAEQIQRGRVMLNRIELRLLRQRLLMSQQDLADDCWRRSIQISLTTIKRAEAGRPVRFRIAREFAKYFEVPVIRIVCGGSRLGTSCQT